MLSGVPFTADELSKVPGGAAGIIDAPVQVSSLGFLLEAPVPDGLSTLQQLCNPDDPNVPDPSKCLVKKAYTGPVKIPTTNLAAMAMHYPGTAFPPREQLERSRGPEGDGRRQLHDPAARRARHR